MPGIVNPGAILLGLDLALKSTAMRSNSAIMPSICATLRRFSST
jgi:hypothetical protein